MSPWEKPKLPLRAEVAGSNYESQDRAASAFGPSFPCCSRHGCLAEILKGGLQKLPGQRRALYITICTQILRYLICLLRIDDAIRVIFRPEVTLQTKDYDGKGVHPLKRPLRLIDPLCKGQLRGVSQQIPARVATWC